MSAQDTQNPDAIVTVGANALGLRSAVLVKRGLALAETVERDFWLEQRLGEFERKWDEGTITEQELHELWGDGPLGKLWLKKLVEGLRKLAAELPSPRPMHQPSPPPTPTLQDKRSQFLAGLDRLEAQLPKVLPMHQPSPFGPPQAKVFLARFASTCSLCGKPIEPQIHYITWSKKRRGYVHHFDCDNPTRIPDDRRAAPTPKDKP